MKIAIGADHGGFELKTKLLGLLNDLGHEVNDHGCHTADSVDYPDFAASVCSEVEQGDAEYGILICGTGIGMAMSANRSTAIRAALCHDDYTARMSREHNNANVLCLGARVTGSGVTEELVKLWLTTEFAGGRHQQRIDKFSD